MAQEQQQDSWSASNYDTHASFVPKLGNIILDKLNAQSSERILDFGCGDGVLTQQLAQKCHTVVGIDASPDMIAKAQSSSSTSAIAYHVVNGHYLNQWFDKENQEPFDAVFSNATLHWLKEPVKAIQGIHHVLKPKGRFVAEFGGFMNCGEVHTALITALNRRGHDGKALSPWYFPSEAEYSKLLQENGFQVEYIELVPRMTQLNTDVAGWLTTFGFNFLEALKDDEERQQVLSEIMEHLRPSYQREDGKWFIMYVRLRVVAHKR
ncbi:S-adenosyl-L-methionine-dependent methyltransferase [Phascolomyces articulosus]|uniref:S-adenosyl-L-methionine-dependent methyltransferase n=1 Tax=Phascolomyces articulosus TaxID=60185 RepID=A0AAD5K7N0_9FUNG|nr:S-adenosyl-L-methionine-dependent methyltransferase [Phascolomyces articulosus]